MKHLLSLSFVALASLTIIGCASQRPSVSPSVAGQSGKQVCRKVGSPPERKFQCGDAAYWNQLAQSAALAGNALTCRRLWGRYDTCMTGKDWLVFAYRGAGMAVGDVNLVRDVHDSQVNHGDGESRYPSNPFTGTPIVGKY